MKLKLVSRGLPGSHRLVDAETGREVEGCRSATIRLDPTNPATVTLEMLAHAMELDVEGIGLDIEIQEAG